MSSNSRAEGQTFWEHLDELRWVILRVVVAIVVAAAVAYSFKDELFAVVFAPKSSDFITYQLLDKLGALSLFGSSGSSSGGEVEAFEVTLINTQLTMQFMTHIKMAIYAGFLVVVPYLLYELFRFVSPALYRRERRGALRIVSWGYVMFIMGAALSYFLIFPFTLRFLASYQVSTDVNNYISLDSYIDTFMLLGLMLGVVFEMPILSWLLGKMGVLSAKFMRKYRRHAIVALLVAAAIITPTTDMVTLLIVTLPMYMLYEVSIWIVAIVNSGERC